MERTPLYSWHKKNAQSIIPFNGFEMPLMYQGIEAEHAHVRSKAGIFDVSHMGEIKITGLDARIVLDYLFTNTLPDVGQVKYGMMLNEHGFVLDDMLVYGLSDEVFWLIVNAGNIKKIMDHLLTFMEPGWIINESHAYGMIALQGPLAHAIMTTYFDFTEIGRFQFLYGDYDDDTMLFSRTGYTGEDGYELYVPSYRLADLWHDLVESSDIAPIGLGARDTLRFEAGLPLYGHEISKKIKPTEANLSFALSKKKNFLGQVSLDSEPGSRQLVGLELLDKGIMREHDAIVCDGKIVGKVTTGYRLKSQGKSLALALIEKAYLDKPLDVEIRESLRSFKIVDYPFLKK